MPQQLAGQDRRKVCDLAGSHGRLDFRSQRPAQPAADARRTRADGLQRLTGDKIKRVFGAITNVPVLGIAIGAGVTAVVQSSSLTTVMAVGFVNASLMTLKQAITIIMGANIGTTITAQLVAFEITQYWAVPLL